MTLLYLIRHGENLDSKVGGVGPTVDLGLSDVGRTQVELLSKRLAADLAMQRSGARIRLPPIHQRLTGASMQDLIAGFLSSAMMFGICFVNPAISNLKCID